MKILVLNGSPKGERSNTLKLSEAFLEGLSTNGDHSIDRVTIKDCNIEPCRGCFVCWTKTPGQCVIKDDMPELIERYIAADLVIWSFPLYYFGMPSKIKAFMDRLLPTNLPFMAEREDGEETYGHPSRYDMRGKRYVLISTCGFSSRENNYEALGKQFEILYGSDLTRIFCPEGELFSIPQLSGRIDEYLGIVQEAGREFGATGEITQETQKKLDELLYPAEAFVEMADASWQITGDGKSTGEESSNGKAFNFMRQMRATFNSNAAQGLEATIEIYYTDIDETYQLQIENGTCTLHQGTVKQPTTRITTTYETWLQISGGQLDGAGAMMEGKYRVTGDFSIMLKMDNLFGSKKKPKQKAEDSTKFKTNMNLFLWPWIAMWIIGPFNLTLGMTAALMGACIVAALGQKRWQITAYERFNPLVMAGLFCLTVFSPLNAKMILAGTYLVFGGIWLLSSLAPIPLTAWYSQYGYGDDALSNPLFVRTNLILTVLWGLLYVLTTFWTYALINTPFFMLSGAINTITPALMGAFTKWFADWYPANVARG